MLNTIFHTIMLSVASFYIGYDFEAVVDLIGGLF